MTYHAYSPSRAPQYYYPQFYPIPQPRPDPLYARPLTPDATREQRKLRKKQQQRWSFGGYAQQPRAYPLTPPPTPAPEKPRRVLWEADYMNAPASSRWPELHPVLAMDTTRVIFDVRVSPEQAINSEAYTRFWNESALRRPTTHMRLVSQDHPWTFELDFRPLFAKRGTPHYVTCGDVWTALTSGLARPITDAEWALFVTSNRPEQAQKKSSMTQTVAMRKVEHGKFLRRVDWLGANVIFRGLVKDDKYAGDVLLPGREPCAETWLVKSSAARA